jgi:DNA transformation protein
MAKNTAFHDYVVYDLMSELDWITSRAMFGGWGIYQYKLIFGIIIGDELYLKVDETNQKDFEKLGSHPFEYFAKSKKVTMSYWLVPGDTLEDREVLRVLVEQSVKINRNKAR